MSQLSVEVRESRGKGVARKLRAQGRIPAVMYGQGKQPLALALEPRALEKLLASEGHNALFDLAGPGVGKRTVLVKELQRDPVRGDLLHADLFEIDANETIVVSVALHLVGTPVGVSMDGGIVDHSLREIEIECLPRAIPERIDVDIANMQLGDALHVSDIALPEGVELMTHGELAVVSVIAAKAEEAAPAVEAAPTEEAAKPAGD
ncbi:MAG: 50S ribosomal protein L25 [Myxococcota bacterium]|nr:50S ribosomal protein L25 [Myxococcales bacterium]